MIKKSFWIIELTCSNELNGTSAVIAVSGLPITAGYPVKLTVFSSVVLFHLPDSLHLFQFVS